MSYRIVYGPPIPSQFQRKSSTHRLQILTAACLLLFAILVRQFFPAGAIKLRQVFLQSTPTVTQEALCDMMGDLRAGSSTRDAFSAFCHQIIEHDGTLSN